MSAQPVSCPAFPDQTPGTSGLRRPRAQFTAPHYVERYVQSVLDCLQLSAGAPLLLCGDSRAGNAELMRRAAGVLAGNGHTRLLSSADGLLTTPAASLAMSRHRCALGLVFTASHNPPGDLGLKLMLPGGAQPDATFNAAVAARSAQPGHYRRAAAPAAEVLPLAREHVALLGALFDFPRLRNWLEGGAGLWFDGAHGAAGPAARLLFGEQLGVPPARLLRCDPRPDLGGQAPDPNLHSMADFIARLGPGDVLAAACDGDGDRNFLHAPGQFIAPGDSLAVIAANLHRFPGYPGGLRGAARSLPTSRAIDRVCAARGVPLHETPSGWRHFAPLLASGEINVCGEEAFGTSSDHIREKDGLWAILAWLSLLADNGGDAGAVLRTHWATFGRDYALRHDFRGLDAARVDALDERLQALSGAGGALQPHPFGGTPPGWQMHLGEETRVVIRRSGTETGGVTLRIYYEQYRPPGTRHDEDSAAVIAPLAARIREALALDSVLGRQGPDLVT